MTRAEYLESLKDEIELEIEKKRENLRRYLDYVSGLPAEIYNRNAEIFQAEIARLDKEIDELLVQKDNIRIEEMPPFGSAQWFASVPEIELNGGEALS